MLHNVTFPVNHNNILGRLLYFSPETRCSWNNGHGRSTWTTSDPEALMLRVKNRSTSSPPREVHSIFTLVWTVPTRTSAETEVKLDLSYPQKRAQIIQQTLVGLCGIIWWRVVIIRNMFATYSSICSPRQRKKINQAPKKYRRINIQLSFTSSRCKRRKKWPSRHVVFLGGCKAPITIVHSP